MTNPVFNPEDPRLTGFVLGEIDDSDRAEIEQLLETSPEAQAAVKEIEDTIGVLKEGLASEPVPELTAEQRAVVEEQLDQTVPVAATTGTSSETDEVVFRRRGVGLEAVMVTLIAVGVLAALVLPQIQSAREYAIADKQHNDEMQSQLVAMNDSAESEESFGFGAGMVDTDDDAFRRQLKSTNESLDSLSLTNGPAGRSVSVKAEVAQGRSVSRRAGRPGVSGDEAVRADDAGALSLSSSDVRREADSAKRDGAQPVASAPAQQPADYDRNFRSKDTSGPGTSSRMIADTSSRQRSGSGSPGNDGLSAPFEEKPTAAPQANRSVTSSSVASKSGARPVSSSAALPGPSSQSEGKSVGDKSNLSKQPAAGGVVVGQKVASTSPAKPQTRDTTVKNRLLVRQGDLPATPQPASGGTVADAPEPARAVALLPGKAPSKKGVLFFESEKEKRVVGRSNVNGPVPPSETASLQQIRKREAELARSGKAEGLAELNQPLDEKQTQLAAIDSGTRRLGQRGLGLPGRNLQEQLEQYSQRLRRRRSSLERLPEARQPGFGFGNETYEAIVENDFIVPVPGDREKSLSTISVDVDTASYANMRRFLNRDQLPPANSVRIEELVNYFNYNYPEPEGNEPFSVKTELASCPWQPSHRLAMVGLKAKTIEKTQRPPTNLVFLLDVSGSMRSSNKLPLVQQSMRLLVEEMTEDDRISIVTYASNAGVRLESTLGSKKQEILNAINGLRAGGSTNGEGGIRMAYDQANRYYFQGGANRIILCSDGDFNVGKSSDGELVELIQEKAASGVFLSVFGFGMGNLKDAKLEKLADKGNGHYGYIDNLNEARKVFQDELVGTLYTVAKDVKLQVEFNPATVGAYRLIGYENRKLAAQDFTDDTKDAGEIGSGHTVTALYEIIPKNVLLEQPRVDGLKYQATEKKPAADTPGADPADKPGDSSDDSVKASAASEELLTVKLRYKKPDEEVSEAIANDYPVTDTSIAGKQLAAASDDLMFAASVASFGMNLRGSKYRGNWGFAEALETAQGAQGDGSDAERTEFIQLVQRAMRITGQNTGPQPRTNQGTNTRPGELDSTAARIKASVDGKYRRLVKKIEVRDDFQRFGAFNDYGHWDGTEYSGHKDLPPGNWVYVYPHWYIWAEVVTPPAESEPTEARDTEKKAKLK